MLLTVSIASEMRCSSVQAAYDLELYQASNNGRYSTTNNRALLLYSADETQY